MLSRYQMRRGAPARELPPGRRIDTRLHTRHVLRPSAAMVEAYLARPGDRTWARFRAAYLELLARRFTRDRRPFDALAAAARERDVYLGCSCPTARNPDVRRCHTWLALEFMHERYPALEVRFPALANAVSPA